MGYIVGIGAANIDICGRSAGPIRMGESNPGFTGVSCGGVTRNVLEILSRLGSSVHLITAMGDDVYGDKLRQSCRELSIDCSRSILIEGGTSSNYMAILDDEGEVLVAVANLQILKELGEEKLLPHRDFVRGADAIVCDPSLSAEGLSYVINHLSGDVPVFCDPVSTKLSAKLLPHIGGCHTLKPNRMELSAMSGIPADSIDNIRRGCDLLLSKGVQRVVVSLGEEGCCAAYSDGRFIKRALRPVREVSNAAGAGDSLMAGLLYSASCGFSEEESLDYAMACGIAAVMSESTINPNLSDAYIRKILEDHRL